jgi:hypothetical protein
MSLVLAALAAAGAVPGTEAGVAAVQAALSLLYRTATL